MCAHGPAHMPTHQNVRRPMHLPDPQGDGTDDPYPDFPEQFARTRRFSLGAVRAPSVSADGRRVVFLRARTGTDPTSLLRLWQDGTERTLADPGELPAAPEPEDPLRERTRELALGVTAFAVDADHTLAAFTLGGALWAVRTEDAVPFRVPVPGPVFDPRPSPDGSRIAYVSEGALHVVGVDGTGARTLAAPEGPRVGYGSSDHVSAESMGRLRGHWWAHGGDAVLAVRVDESDVQLRWYADPFRPERAPRSAPYPAAGTANPRVTLHVLRLDGERVQVALPGGDFEYLPAAGWDAHGPFATVQTRDQRTLRTLAVDPATGHARTVSERTDAHWVELISGTPCRTASGALVEPLDDDGCDTRRLAVDGRAVTPPGLQLTAVHGTQGDAVLFGGVEEPTEEHVYRYTPERGCERLSAEPGVHTAAVGGGTVVLDSAGGHGRCVTLHRGDALLGELATLTEEPVPQPRPRLLVLGERRMRCALFLPGGREPRVGTRLPVLLSPYGGPGTRLVRKGSGWQDAVAQWFAEQGFAVLVADGRGTPGRGPAWEKAISGDQLGPALEDQVDAVRAAAAELPYLDLSRVGIRGWSFGGTLAAAAVLRRPDVFHVAAAGAAPTDQRHYDSHWKERFLGHPDEHPAHYARSSLLDDAPGLRRPLLLMHGTADDNVAFTHTLKLSAALLAAGRPHTVLPLPGETHLVRDPVTQRQLLRYERDFLLSALPPTAPQS